MIRYVLENYGPKVLWGKTVVYTNKVPPPIEVVSGRVIFETRVVYKSDGTGGYIHVPKILMDMLFKRYESLGLVKTPHRRKSGVLRVLVLVEVLPLSDDVDLLLKLAELYEEESRRYREIFQFSKLRRLLEEGCSLHSFESRRIAHEVESILNRL